MTALGHGSNHQRVAVWIGIIAQDTQVVAYAILVDLGAVLAGVWLVVDPVDGNGHRGCVRTPVPVAHRVAKGIRCLLADAQPLELGVGVVVEGTVAVAGHQAGGAGGVKGGHRELVAGVGVRVVAQDVARGEGGVLIGGKADAGIVDGVRGIVHPGDGDGDRGRIGAAVFVRDGVEEGIGGLFSDAQPPELTVWAVVEGTIAVVGHQAEGAGGVKGEHRERVVGVGVGVRGQDVARGKECVLVGGKVVAGIVDGVRGIVHPVDSDGDRG